MDCNFSNEWETSEDVVTLDGKDLSEDVVMLDGKDLPISDCMCEYLESIIVWNSTTYQEVTHRSI